MRIIGGAMRGLALQAPPGLNTRPTADRARQTLFDMIMHAPWGGRDALIDRPVLDVFAGSGALGLEALSRGAASASFIEQDAAALRCLRANVASSRAADRCRVLACSALRPPAGGACGLVFLDPPYRQDLIVPSVAALQKAGWIASGTVIVAEIAADEGLPIPHMLAERRIGAARFCIWCAA